MTALERVAAGVGVGADRRVRRAPDRGDGRDDADVRKLRADHAARVAEGRA